MKKVKLNEEANEKDPCIKSEGFVSGNSSLLMNSQRKFMYAYNKKNAHGK